MKSIAFVFVALCGILNAQDSQFSGPSNANPPVSKDDIRIVQRAREILSSEAKWNRADNRECPASQKTYSLYCALEKATREVSQKFEHRGAAMQQARFLIDELLKKDNHYEHRLMGFNNDPKTTFADVQKFFSLLEERIKRQLAARETNKDIKVNVWVTTDDQSKKLERQPPLSFSDGRLSGYVHGSGHAGRRSARLRLACAVGK